MRRSYERTASPFLAQVAFQCFAAKGGMLVGGHNRLESDQEHVSMDEARALRLARVALARVPAHFRRHVALVLYSISNSTDLVLVPISAHQLV